MNKSLAITVKDEIIQDIWFTWETELKKEWLKKNNKFQELGLVKEIRTTTDGKLEAVSNGRITTDGLSELLKETTKQGDNYATTIIKKQLEIMKLFN